MHQIMLIISPLYQIWLPTIWSLHCILYYFIVLFTVLFHYIVHGIFHRVVHCIFHGIFHCVFHFIFHGIFHSIFQCIFHHIFHSIFYGILHSLFHCIFIVHFIVYFIVHFMVYIIVYFMVNFMVYFIGVCMVWLFWWYLYYLQSDLFTVCKYVWFALVFVKYLCLDIERGIAWNDLKLMYLQSSCYNWSYHVRYINIQIHSIFKWPIL